MRAPWILMALAICWTLCPGRTALGVMGLPDQSEITAIYVDHGACGDTGGNRVWLGTGKGLFLVENYTTCGGSEQVSEAVWNPAPEDQTPPAVRALTGTGIYCRPQADEQPTVFAGTDKGLFWVTSEALAVRVDMDKILGLDENADQPEISALVYMPDIDVLVIGTEKHGLFFWFQVTADPWSKKMVRFLIQTLGNTSITALAVEKNDSGASRALWIGTKHRGLAVLRKMEIWRLLRFMPYSEPLPSETITALLIVDEPAGVNPGAWASRELYVGTPAGLTVIGLDDLDPDTWHVYDRHDFDPPVYEDSDVQVDPDLGSWTDDWVTALGFEYLPPLELEPGDPIPDYLQSRLWVGTFRGGAGRFDLDYHTRLPVSYRPFQDKEDNPGTGSYVTAIGVGYQNSLDHRQVWMGWMGDLETSGVAVVEEPGTAIHPAPSGLGYSAGGGDVTLFWDRLGYQTWINEEDECRPVTHYAMEITTGNRVGTLLIQPGSPGYFSDDTKVGITLFNVPAGVYQVRVAGYHLDSGTPGAFCDPIFITVR